MVRVLSGIGAERDFLQARPSWGPYHVLPYQVVYLFSLYDLSLPSDMSASWRRGFRLFDFL